MRVRLLLGLLGWAGVASAGDSGNTVVQLAQEQGVRTCLPAVEKVSNHIIGTARHGAQVETPRPNPDDSYITATIERVSSDGSAMSSMTVMHTRANTCAAVYEQVMVLDDACIIAASSTFKDFHLKGTLTKSVSVLTTRAEDIQVYLMDVKGGCLVMKKEALPKLPP